MSVSIKQMTALEKIIQKCEFDHDAKFNLAELYCKAHPKEVSEGLYISGAFLENHLLMPIIRELCAVIEEQQKALNKTLSSIGEVECNERTTREIEINYHVSDADYHARARLSRLADSEGVK